MATDLALQPVDERGWRMGLANMLHKENGAWWRTRSWLVQTAIWLFIINGSLLGVLSAPITELGDGPPGGIGNLLQVKATAGLFIFIILSGIAPAIGTVIAGQDALLDEKRLGTAAWVLSKPVSRVAFIISKLIADAFGILITAVLIQGAAAYIQISAAGGTLAPGAFLAALGLIFLNLMFYLTLTVMLSAFFNSRGAVIGIPMGLLFGYQLLLNVAPWSAQIMPWSLVSNVNNDIVPTAVSVALGLSPTSITPIVATVVWIVLFIVLALWRFNREEF